nr:hypothetical protein [Tanacetum cinerariifolium]
MCDMVSQLIQKKEEEKRIEEEQTAKAQNWKLHVCYDNDDDEERSNSLKDNIISGLPPCAAITPNEPSLYDEDVPEKIFSNPLFKEEIIPMKIDPYHFNAESDLTESLLNHDSFIIPSSSKIDSFLNEFAEIRLIERLLYDNLSPRPLEEFVFDNSDAEIVSFSPSPIPVEDSDSFMEEIDLTFTSDDPMPPGIEEDDYDSERDILIREELLDNYSLPLLVIESYHFDIPLFSRPPAKPPDVQVWGELAQAQRPKTSASWEAPHAYP